MKQTIMFLLCIMGFLNLNAQTMGIKTNILYDATATFNLGAEIGLGKRTSLDISGNYNPWDFSNNKRWKHWLVQPEFRYWLCERFNGHFFGIHAHVGQFNVNKLDLFSDNLKNHNYQGDFYGGGISYGYQWMLSTRWSIEASLGVGYAHVKYDKYPCTECGTIEKSDTRNYWGPTKAAVSIVYYIF